MAAIAVTYSFTNGTTSDATQVNQNFTDIINGLSDGTKDISVSAGTFAGNVSISGNTTIGNASGDDLTVTASLASSIPIKTTNSYDIGSSTLGLRALYFGANSQTVKIQGSSSMSATWTLTLPVSAGSDKQFLQTNGSGVASWVTPTSPTVQKFTTGSGTYTTPANVRYIKVKLVGGGGGGAGSGTASGGGGGGGGNTTFGSSLLQGSGGNGAGALSGGVSAGGAGGSYTLNSPAIGLGITGDSGAYGQYTGSSGPPYLAGGNGGNSPYFSGSGKGTNATTGGSAITNTGGGGGGAGTGAVIGSTSGGGGGSGGYVEAIISSPSASYSYAIGAAGTAGTAGTSGSAGGAGGSGYIIVEEYY